ncbi:MAG: UDP-2-acetamido-3-amino-2,3-dideoxy-D-glucuronate N-acetyltransferase [Planctomycetes bacterium]|nr:UDP-2-acetamido-3-amino-2,3-dideoxy-D-glucuronate N-acetyltransferase [Planctomycetota bacterium]
MTPPSTEPSTDRGWKAHPSAVVDEGARIGDGTSIWHFSHVMPGARIGRRCNLGQNVFVANGTTLGDNVKVQNNVSIYEGVHLEDDVFCGPSMVFTNVMNPRSHVSRKHEYRETRVGRGATLGANCTVVCGNRVGRYAFVGAGSVVSRDVPDFALVMGVPARIAGFMCRCGVRLDLAPKSPAGSATCRECGAVYAWDGAALRESDG